MATKKKQRASRPKDPFANDAWIPKSGCRTSQLLAFRAGWRNMQKTTHPDLSFAGYIRLALTQLTEVALQQK